MEDILKKTFDFGIRVVELSNYLLSEKRHFALNDRLLDCGTIIGVCMRISIGLPQYRRENCALAFKKASEAEYLLELMVKTGVLAENQSKPILSECRSIKDEIGKLLGNMPD